MSRRKISLIHFLKWLHPGIGIKRWILLASLGLGMVGIGSAEILIKAGLYNRLFGLLTLIIGVGLVVSGIKQMMQSLITAILPKREEELVNILYHKRHLVRGPKIVAIGGGTGLSTLLRGLKEYTNNITAIVTVTDDGGSSGRLRTQFDVPPPGDIRNCLVALADAEPLMGELFQYRFQEGTDLKGHSFGNLFITAMTQVAGDFDQAIKQSSKILAIRGRVVPSTLKRVTLIATHEDGKVTYGETRLAKSKSPVKDIELRPNDCKPTPEALDAIVEAEAIILGPGSLYTSVISNLLVGGVVRAIENSTALKVYICNVMTQSGETDGYSASDHVKALVAHTSPRILDVCVVNSGTIPAHLLAKYKEEGASQVMIDREAVKEMGYRLVEKDVITTKDFVRHDSDKLAKLIISLVETGEVK